MNPCIMVFGMPRSGTTWVGKLFDSHPDTLYRHEPDSVRRLEMPLFADPRQAASWHAQVTDFVEAMPALRAVKVVGKQPLFYKHYQSTAALAVYRAGVATAKAAGRIGLALPCVARPDGRAGGPAPLVWKSIESYGRLAACMAILPQARAVYLMRHPGAYVASILRGRDQHRFAQVAPRSQPFWHARSLLGMPAARAHGLDMDALVELSIEEQLAWKWVLTQETVLADVAGCDNVLTMRHEDVCADPVAATRRMFAFTGLAWSARTEAFITSSTRGTDVGYYSVFRAPADAANRWRRELSSAAVRRIMDVLAKSYLQGMFNEPPMPHILGTTRTVVAS